MGIRDWGLGMGIGDLFFAVSTTHSNYSYADTIALDYSTILCSRAKFIKVTLIRHAAGEGRLTDRDQQPAHVYHH